MIDFFFIRLSISKMQSSIFCSLVLAFKAIWERKFFSSSVKSNMGMHETYPDVIIFDRMITPRTM